MGGEADVSAYLADESDVEDVLEKMEQHPNVRGVPHFVISTPGVKPMELSGAQESEVFQSIFQQMQQL